MAKDPIPWVVKDTVFTGERSINIYSGHGRIICHMREVPCDEDRDRAELIVKAVNSYQAMKEALEGLMYTVKALDEDYDLIDSYKKAKKALTLANGGTSE